MRSMRTEGHEGRGTFRPVFESAWCSGTGGREMGWALGSGMGFREGFTANPADSLSFWCMSYVFVLERRVVLQFEGLRGFLASLHFLVALLLVVNVTIYSCV